MDTLLFKVVTSRKAIAVQEVMQNSQNVKNSLPTEYLCRTSKGLCLDKNRCILWRLPYWFSRCCTIVAWLATTGITDTLCRCSELSVWLSCDFFRKWLLKIYHSYHWLIQCFLKKDLWNDATHTTNQRKNPCCSARNVKNVPNIAVMMQSWKGFFCFVRGVRAVPDVAVIAQNWK